MDTRTNVEGSDAGFDEEVGKPSSPLRVAIVGGGIGGLALATFLASSRHRTTANLDVTLYEAAPSLTELGAGVGLWLRTWKILASYEFDSDLWGYEKCEDESHSRPEGTDSELKGLARELMKFAPVGRNMSDEPQKAFEFRKGDRSDGVSFHIMTVPFGVLTLHRAEFQQCLAKYAVPETKTLFNKRLASYSYASSYPDSEIVLTFEDGTETRCDVLVGADGIRSPTRRSLLAKRTISEKPMSSFAFPPRSDAEAIQASIDADPVWSGTLVYRSLIRAEALEERHHAHRASERPVVYFGKSKHIIAFPISTAAGKMVNMVAFVSDPSKEGTQLEGPWVRPAEQSEILSTFEGWEDEVLSLVGLAQNPMLWAIHTVRPLSSFSDDEGRVALLGDAAHAMAPHQGAGGGQAIEDAHVLAALLAHPRLTKESVPDALQAYDSIRVPVARRVMENSRMTGMLYEFNDPSLMSNRCVASKWRNRFHRNTDSGFAENFDVNDLHDRGNEGVLVSNDGSRDDSELEDLQKLAQRIMNIHDWEWTNVYDGVNQASRAVELFERAIQPISLPDKNHCITEVTDSASEAAVPAPEKTPGALSRGRARSLSNRGRLWAPIRLVRKAFIRLTSVSRSIL